MNSEIQPQPNTETIQGPQIQEQSVTETHQPKKNGKLLLISAIALILIIFISFYFSTNSAGQKTAQATSSISNTTSVAPVRILNVSTLVNKSNALFGIPNQGSFTLSSSFQNSSISQNTNYTTVGTVAFYSNSYGLDFTDPVINYSSTVPLTYNLPIPPSYASENSPVAVMIYLWKASNFNYSTAEYLENLQYAYNSKTAYNSSQRPNNINSSINIYYMANGSVVNSTGINTSTLIPYSKNVNISAAPAFMSSIAPVYVHLIQNQVTLGYKDYVITIYTFGILGKYNENYTKIIASHFLSMLKSRIYA